MHSAILLSNKCKWINTRMLWYSKVRNFVTGILKKRSVAVKVYDCRGVKSLNFVICLQIFEFYGESLPFEYHLSIKLRVGKGEYELGIKSKN